MLWPWAETEAAFASMRCGRANSCGCSETTSEGSIWPVDAALRPEGKSGPLVRTVASHEAYYKRWAKPWEFRAVGADC